jgi:hypothetical protein
MTNGRDRGFIGIIILVVIALVLLKWFYDWSIFDAAATPHGQDTIGYGQKVINTIWSWISGPVLFIWSKILWPLLNMIWNTFQAFLAWGHANAAKGL